MLVFCCCWFGFFTVDACFLLLLVWFFTVDACFLLLLVWVFTVDACFSLLLQCFDFYC